MKKILAIVLMMSVFSLNVWSNGNGEESAKSEKITLSAIHYYNVNNRAEDPRVDAWYSAVEKFEAAHPEVELEFEYIPHDAYQDKAQILAAANELPDLFDVKGSWIKQFVQNGRVMKLDDLLESDSEFKSILKVSSYKNFLVDDSYYGLALNGGSPSHMIVYNKDILKEAGFDEFPKTYDEFKRLIKEVKTLGYTPISMGNKGKWLIGSCYLSTIGSRFTGPEWTKSITDKTGATFTDPRFVESLKVLNELAEMEAFNSDMNSVDYVQQRTPYYNGKAAMFVEGFWAINDIIKNAQPEVLEATNITVWPDFERGEGAPNSVSGGAGGWAVALNPDLEGEKKELAFEFMKTFLSKESGAKLSAKGLIPGILPGEYDDSQLHRLNIEAIEIVDNITPADIYDSVWDASVIDVMNSDLQMLVLGLITPEELAANAQEEYEALE